MTPLEEIIQKEVRRQLSQVTVIGKVSGDVDIDSRTCNVVFEDGQRAPVKGCRLNAIISDYKDNVLIVPRKDSYVMVTGVEGNAADKYVVGYSEVDRVSVKIGDTSVDMDKDGIVFNGGDNKGMVKIEELTDKLNALKDTLNDLTNSYNTHTHVVNASVSIPNATATGTAIATTSQAQQAQAFDMSYYENDKVKH
jgi:hypothetical protein